MIYAVQLHSLVATAKANCGATGNFCQTNLPQAQLTGNTAQHLLQIFFAILAAIAVLFVVIGGMRYVYSEGDPEATSRARGTIIYAAVGLILALSAEAFVSLVIGRVQL